MSFDLLESKSLCMSLKNGMPGMINIDRTSCDHKFPLFRTRAVIIVEASLKHPNSVNRTILDCVRNGQPAVCVNLMLCFNYTGQTIPGYIGKPLCV